jgi:capsular polysaccharide biosynthesis protein
MYNTQHTKRLSQFTIRNSPFTIHHSQFTIHLGHAMEFRAYWQIIRRRWWLPIVLTALVTLFSLSQLQPWQTPPPLYTASLRMLIGVLPAAASDATAYDPRYYAWLTSEYLVDDFTEVVRSELFAKNVSARLAQQNITVPASTIQGSAATGKQHRIISLSLTWPDRNQLAAIADATAVELHDNAANYFRQLGTDGAGITLLDGPAIGVVGPTLRSRLELPLRILLGLFVGLGLLFLLDYLDTSIRTREEVETLGLHIIGEIPRHR